MIKTILGIDEAGLYEGALRLLVRLKVDELAIEVVHVEESRILSSLKDFGYASEYELSQLDFDENLVNKAAKLVSSLALPVTSKVIHGSPSKELVKHAQLAKADLIAIGSKRRSKFNSSMFNSMSRALSIGAKQSILIAKGEIQPEGPLAAVVTTDHSEYSDKAIRLLLKWNPIGLQKLILLTAFDRSMFGNRPAQADTYRQLLTEKSKKVTEAFIKHSIPTEYRIIDGDLGEVVEAQMDDVKADLLIMGAQGHGYMRPLLIGSSSLKQVVSSRHSVLILRP